MSYMIDKMSSGRNYYKQRSAEKIAATVTEPHHHIIVTYEEDSDIEVDCVAISVVPLVDFLLTT